MIKGQAMARPSLLFQAVFVSFLLTVASQDQTQSQCPFTDVSKIFRKIQKMEKKLFDQLKYLEQKVDKGVQAGQCSPGVQGPLGEPGPDGVTGVEGDLGRRGRKGQRGDPCIPRPPSYAPTIKGYPGVVGPKGRKGYKGDKGSCVCEQTGEPCPKCTYLGSGSQGDKGDPGIYGPDGIPGIDGEKGESESTHDEAFSIPGRPGLS